MNSDFAFGKVLGIADCLYGNIPAITNSIARLMQLMKETNDLHKVQCEFFRLDFRQPYFDEQYQFPIGSLILDMKWGSKKELEETNIVNYLRLKTEACEASLVEQGKR